MIILSLILLLIALSLMLLARIKEKKAGLPSGKIIAIDQKGWRSLERPLFSARFGITGKPDYLLEKDRHILPVEVKTGNLPHQPYPAHIFQLAAYCILIEETYHQTPPYGILHYHLPANRFQSSSRTWQIPFTSDLRKQLIELMDEMRAESTRIESPRSHDQPARCSHCGYRHICDQKLE